MLLNIQKFLMVSKNQDCFWSLQDIREFFKKAKDENVRYKIDCVQFYNLEVSTQK